MKIGFLQWIVTDDEIWVHHYEPASKCQSMDTKHTPLPRTKKLKSVLSVKLMMFWNNKEHLLKYYEDSGQNGQ
jgi:hypothetical protein